MADNNAAICDPAAVNTLADENVKDIIPVMRMLLSSLELEA